MKTLLRKFRNSRGQAAVETLFSIPIFLILFVIGFELFAITWNAQYAHATARYSAFAQAHHNPCRAHDDGTAISSIDATSDDNDVSADESPYMTAFAKDHQMTQHAYIVCN